MPIYLCTYTCYLIQEWDSELARLAQYSSAKCEYMRNEHRHDQSTDYDYVGENIAATGEYMSQQVKCAVNCHYGQASRTTKWHIHILLFNYISCTYIVLSGVEESEVIEKRCIPQDFVASVKP